MISEPLKTEPAYNEVPLKNRKILEGIQQYQQQTLKLENRNMLHFQASKQQLAGVKTERKGRVHPKTQAPQYTTMEPSESSNSRSIKAKSKGNRVKTEEDLFVDADYYKIRPMIIEGKRDDETCNNIKRPPSKGRSVLTNERSSPTLRRLKLNLHRIGKERQHLDGINTQILSLREYSVKEESKIEGNAKTSRSKDRYSNLQKNDLSSLKRFRQK